MILYDPWNLTAALNRWLDQAAVSYLDTIPIEKLKYSSRDLKLFPLSEAGYATIGSVYAASIRKLERISGIGRDGASALTKAAREYVRQARQEVPIRMDYQNQPDADTKLLTAVYGKLYQQDVGQKPGAVPAKEDIWADFSRRSSDYYAVIEQADPYRESRSGNGKLPEQLVREVSAVVLELSGFKGTLRTYQKFGTQYAVHQMRCLLGDEMGLGKTVQALGVFCHLHSLGKRRFLVVCPASVLVNWQRECEKFTDIPSYIFHGQDTEDDIRPWLEQGGIGITNFETLGKLLPLFGLSSEPVSSDSEETVNQQSSASFDFVVVDEAHYLKNPEAARTQNAAAIINAAAGVMLMSGTPLENKTDEMCQLIRLVNPQTADELEQMAAYDKATQFEQKACGVYLRRTRDDVLQELPDLIEEDSWLELSGEERGEYYVSVAAGNFMAMRQVSWEMKDPAASVKAQRLKEICQEARENKRKVIVFSFFRNTLEKARQILGEWALEPINGSVPVTSRQKILDRFSKDDTFQNEKEPFVLPCQVISGGMGLNIQAASVVIFCEPQIKPSLETQAISRAYRMGQVQNVLVFRLYAKDTVDESIRSMLMDKQIIFDDYADPSA
ncbi:MAG: DEAD/DEAH box helicase family protein, partial [Firmicutes bacterium]|nr:DEAD/DEAH box helicase family protein [Bacillota bacterium]